MPPATDTRPAIERIRAEREAKEDPFNQDAARAEARKAAKARERVDRAAYDTGRADEAAGRRAPPRRSAPAPGASSETSGAETPSGDTPAQGAPAPATGGGRGRLRLSRPGHGVADNGAGFVLGMIGYALLLNGIKGGPGQSWAWVKAKFVNQTTATHTPAQSAANQAAISAQVGPSFPPASQLPTPQSGVGPGMYYPAGPLGTIVGAP